MQSGLVVVALLYLVTLVLFVGLHLRGDRNPIRDAVSTYAIGPTRTMFMMDGAAGGAASALLGLILLADGRFPTRASLFLLAHGILRVGVLAFTADPVGQTPSRHGRLHYTFAIPGFAMVYLAVHTLTPMARGMVAGWPGLLLGLLHISAGLSLVAVVASLTRPLAHVFGLVERVFLLSTALWLALFSVAMIPLLRP